MMGGALKDKAETQGKQEGALREDLPPEDGILLAALHGIETEVFQIVEGNPLLSSGFEGVEGTHF